MSDDVFQAWVREQHDQQSWTDSFREADLRALYDRYPGMSLDELVLIAMRKQPEKFDAIGVTIDGQKPSEYVRETRYH